MAPVRTHALAAPDRKARGLEDGDDDAILQMQGEALANVLEADHGAVHAAQLGRIEATSSWL